MGTCVMHNGTHKGDTDHDFDATVVVFAAAEKKSLQLLVGPHIQNIDVSTVKYRCEPIFEHVRAMVHRMKPFIPLNLVDYLRKLHQNRQDVGVEFVAADRSGCTAVRIEEMNLFQRG